MIKSDIRGETIKYSSNIAQINKVKTINIERELTELQNKKQASNREEIPHSEQFQNQIDY
jgi:hypothetical protein